MTPGGKRPGESSEPGFGTLLKWSAIMLLGSLLVAAVSIPLLRLFGVEWGD